MKYLCQGFLIWGHEPLGVSLNRFQGVREDQIKITFIFAIQSTERNKAKFILSLRERKRPQSLLTVQTVRRILNCC